MAATRGMRESRAETFIVNESKIMISCKDCLGGSGRIERREENQVGMWESINVIEVNGLSTRRGSFIQYIQVHSSTSFSPCAVSRTHSSKMDLIDV